MRFSVILAAAGLTTGINACYLTAHSSTVGNFDVQHSEPKDHGGAPQYVDWSYEGCTIKGQLLNGCGVKTTSTTGCGTVTFSIRKAGRFARYVRVVESKERK